jgi:hypothetical protein
MYLLVLGENIHLCKAKLKIAIKHKLLGLETWASPCTPTV